MAAACRIGEARFSTEICLEQARTPGVALGTSARVFTSVMSRRSPTSSFHGRSILIVQRSWVIARNLANAFEAKGARALIARDARSGLRLANDPRLSAAVLDSASHALRLELKAKGIPFVLYTAHEQIDDAPIVRKPASPATIVARVEELLSE